MEVDLFEEDFSASEMDLMRQVELLKPLMSILGVGVGDGAGAGTDVARFTVDGRQCGGDNDDVLAILSIIALALLLLYLIVLATTTTTAGRRRRRDVDPDVADVDVLDAPTWLSMVQELWDQDAAVADEAQRLSCAKRALCRMNRVAQTSTGQVGWAVSLSSVPLSYLLHHRHQDGLSNYLDASLMGFAGANCSMMYHNCPLLH